MSWVHAIDLLRIGQECIGCDIGNSTSVLYWNKGHPHFAGCSRRQLSGSLSWKSRAADLACARIATRSQFNPNRRIRTEHFARYVDVEGCVQVPLSRCAAHTLL